MSLFMATSVAFGVVFGLFIAAVVFLVIWVAVWAVRRDSAGRKTWMQDHDPASGTADVQEDESSP